MAITAMKIMLNGKERECASGTTIQQLLDQIGTDKSRIAVELNLHIVDKSKLHQQVLKENDRLEIVTFVGGGISR